MIFRRGLLQHIASSRCSMQSPRVPRVIMNACRQIAVDSSSNSSSSSYDFIIVGGGSSGCLLANRLSQDSSKQVLLLEAGGRDNFVWIHIPVGYLYCIDNPRTDWRFKTEMCENLHNRSLLYPRGKVLGGCSSINGMIYMRGQRTDFDSWADITGGYLPTTTS
jgi:choline dehydrogenase